jgi:ankyrin repeat protein
VRAQQIIEAAKAGDRAAIERLLHEDPALLHARHGGETPVLAALYRGHKEIVAMLLSRMSDAGQAPDILTAAAVGELGALDAALRANPGAANTFAEDGWTPLHLAGFFCHADAVRRLLDAGAQPGAVSRNSLRNTALHAALAGGCVEAALLLIERGADVKAVDSGGYTPLHIAAENGQVAAVKALLARGADPHAVDAEDKTPLSRAAARNQNDVIDAINLWS